MRIFLNLTNSVEVSKKWSIPKNILICQLKFNCQHKNTDDGASGNTSCFRPEPKL